MTFAIADYLTDDQKRRACAETYEPSPDGPRANGAYCPLGIALDYTTDPSPSAGQVASALRIKPGTDAWWEAFDAAAQFEGEWDAGKIPDLYAALGVPR